METVVSFTRRGDWAEPLQVYCPPCEVCRGENVTVWIVDRFVFVVVSRILPSMEVTGWPLESIHWAVDELMIPLRILVMLHLREYCCPAIGIPSTLMLGTINSGTKGKVYQLSVKVIRMPVYLWLAHYAINGWEIHQYIDLVQEPCYNISTCHCDNPPVTFTVMISSWTP